MSRIAINAAEIRAAFDKLLTQGTEPNAKNIRDLLQKGTLPSIQKQIDGIIKSIKPDLLSDIHPVQPEPEPVPTPIPVVAKAPISAPEPIVVQKPVTIQIKTPIEAPAPQQPTHNQNAQHTQKRPQFQVKKPQQQQQQRREPQHQNQNQNHAHHQNQHQAPNQNQHFDYEPTPEAPLESLSAEALVIKIRRLESSLLKEQARRETAEKIALETKDYADLIKEQVAHRINDLRQNMDLVIEQLKTQLREQKQTYADDLKSYQDQINKANQGLLTN
ncbi:MAG: hypothetical protein NTV32_00620 [Gammaproteobacteria bacterium]|jgi:hypothetical protein|nr:hypothetical protein [Gammaproteobacteria bacterium]